VQLQAELEKLTCYFTQQISGFHIAVSVKMLHIPISAL